MLLCAGAITAHAAVGDVVTSISDIKSNTVYTLSLNERGYMPNGNGSTQMIGTQDASAAGKFLIIKVDELSFSNQNQYVIYSIDNAKFMTNRRTNTNVYDATPAQALFNISASNQANRFLIKSSYTDLWLQFGGSSQFLLADGWKTQDVGNRWAFTVVEENVDISEATDKINSYINSYVTDETALSNTATYIVKNVNRAFINTTATVANAGRANYAEIAILKGSKGHYLYDVAHNKFIGTNSLTSTEMPLCCYTLSRADANSTTRYNFTLTSSENNHLLQSDSSNPPVLTITSTWTTLDDGNKWAFFPAGTFDSTDAMAKIAAMEAELVSNPITSLDELSTTGRYVLKNRGYDGYLKGNTNGEHLLYVATANIKNLNDPVYHWEIVNIPDEGYAFRNVGTGTYITNLNNDVSAHEWRMTNDPVFVYNALTEKTDDAENKFFAIRNVDKSYPWGDINYAHMHVNGSGSIVNWEESNQYSQYSISLCGTVDDYAETMTTALATAATNRIAYLTSDAMNPEGADGRIGFLTAEGNAAIAPVCETANTLNANESATIHEKIDAIRTLNTKIAESNSHYVHVEPGKYYTIRGAHTDYAAMYLTESYELTEDLTVGSGDEAVTATHNKLVAAELEENPIPAYWTFNKTEGEGISAKYNIAAANSGSLMRQVAWTKSCLLLPDGHAEVGVYNYMDKQNRQFGGVNLRGTDITLSMSSDGNGASATDIRTYNGKVNGNNWIIEPVDSVPVTFNSNGYAAIKFPFAVQLPAGVTAYDLSTISADNVAITVAHDGSIIAAGTPVFLKGNKSAKLLVVSPTEEAAALANEGEETSTSAAALQGSLMPETVENAFVLDGASLIPATGKVSANSAYFVSTPGDTTPKTLSGAITTGIDEITMDKNADNDDMIYDLQGRRLAAPIKGINIINGKKVLVR